MALGAGDHWPSIMASLSAEALDEKASQYLKSVGAGAGDALWVTDKMPINFRYIGWIRQLFPQARIVHLQRHPLDVGLSCLRQHFVGDGNAWSTSLEGIAGLMEDHARLMKHWRAQRTDDLMELRYEDLVTEPEGTIRQLLDFVGLPFVEACLSPHESTRSVNTASWSQVREPIHPGAIAKWKAYAKGLRPLAAARDLGHEVDAHFEDL